MKNQNVSIPYLAAPGPGSPRGNSRGERKNIRGRRKNKNGASPRIASSSSSRSGGKRSLKAMP
eukprot:3940845-Prorocentrum_lima.AAC.1